MRGYARRQEAGIAQYQLKTRRQVARHYASSDVINPCAVFHRSDEHLFYTVEHHYNRRRLTLSKLSTAATPGGATTAAAAQNVLMTSALDLDVDAEQWLLLDTTPSASLLLLQVLQAEFQSHSTYNNQTRVYNATSLQCLRKYDRLIVEPCHIQCLYNFQPRFSSEARFHCSFPNAQRDTMFDCLDDDDDDDDVSSCCGDNDNDDDVTTTSSAVPDVVFKLPLVLSLKAHAKQTIRDHVTVVSSHQQQQQLQQQLSQQLSQLQQLPEHLINYLKS